MTYLSWSAFYEGPTDALYFDVLLPRLMEEALLVEGVGHSDIPVAPAIGLGKNGRTVDAVAAELCESKDAFQLVFIHADAGGAGLAQGLATRSTAYCEKALELCQWPPVRCVTVTPRHETEAWILADPHAVVAALGYARDAEELGLPANAHAAEHLIDPKAVLLEAILRVRGRNRRTGAAAQLFPAIAQRQGIQRLRESNSFAEFEGRLRRCLQSLGCIPHG